MVTRKEQHREDVKVVEAAIAEACAQGWMKDVRDQIKTANERYGVDSYQWPKRLLKEVLGQCTHHNASKNTDNPGATANYHTSKNNHITPSRPLPSIIYPIAIPKTGEVLITGEILDRTYGQAYGGLGDGDENLHLVPVLVMGGFKAPGYRGHTGKAPTSAQMRGHTHACQWLSELADFDGAGMFYHAHFGKAGCPGYVLMERIDAWRDSALQDLKTDLDWQQALLRWDDSCLPKYGADGDWGRESKTALVAFQRLKGIQATGIQDPFTELVLLRDHPMPESNTQDPNT